MCDSDGSNLVRVTSLGAEAGTPRWSPDGGQIAFDFCAEREDRDIYVVRAEGGAPRRLTTDPAEEVVPSWSRDGQWIYFAANHNGDWQVWKIPAAGGETLQVTKQGGFLAFESPDGKFVYYAKGLTLPGLWRVPVAGGEETPVLDRLQVGHWGNWAVVEEGIYFLNPEAKDGAAIEFFSFATRRVTKVAGLGNVSLFPHGFAVSPDRRWILYPLWEQSGSDIMFVENFR
jgi:dipeptidyl aminopeptidase/acylaminoacyl peptidase